MRLYSALGVTPRRDFLTLCDLALPLEFGGRAVCVSPGTARAYPGVAAAAVRADLAGRSPHQCPRRVLRRLKFRSAFTDTALLCAVCSASSWARAGVIRAER